MNKRPFFITNLSVLALLLVTYMIYVYGFGNNNNWVIPFVFVAYSLLNVLLYRMLVNANDKSPARFITAFTGVVGIKLMSALVFLLIYLLTTDVDPIPVVAAVFLGYTGFTIALIRVVLSTIREK